MILLGDFAPFPASPPTLLRGVMSIAASTLLVIRKSLEGMETMTMNSAHRWQCGAWSPWKGEVAQARSPQKVGQAFSSSMSSKDTSNHWPPWGEWPRTTSHDCCSHSQTELQFNTLISVPVASDSLS